MVSAGAIPSPPASIITMGMDEMTLLPRLDRMASATPKVITNNDSTCCHTNGITRMRREFPERDFSDISVLFIYGFENYLQSDRHPEGRLSAIL